MTRLDAGVEETAGAPDCDGPRAIALAPREVPLGGIRGMSVRRSLPQRDLPMVGAWCFLDRFGPQATRMRVEPHPHTGLQTVTWPLIGEVRHRDSLGSDVLVSRGALNLMTSGHGISHSEYSLGEEPVPLDALQLWVALPEESRNGPAGFERHEDLPERALRAVDGGEGGGTAVVVLGILDGVRSPATTHTPIVGAELRLEPDARVTVPLTSDWEHALVGVRGAVGVHAAPGAPHDLVDKELLYLGVHRDEIVLQAGPDGATVFLLGGEPFPDEIVMWWNFVARSHDEIVQAREEWEAGAARFGRVDGHGDVRIPAPPMPAVRLTPRRRRL